MKIAVCYSGAVRGLLSNFDHVKKVLFPDHKEHEIDYYLYADKNGGTIHKKDIESGKLEPQGLKVKSERPDFNCRLVDELNGFPERLSKFEQNIINYHMPYKEQVHQWYSVKKVFDFVFEQEKEYDVYVRMRCDLFPAGKMEFNWDTFDKDTIYVPYNAPFGGINDRFAFGSKDAMKVYSNFYDSKIYYNSYNLRPEVVSRAQEFYNKFYGHIPTDDYGNGGHNSEFRMLNHILDNDLNIEILPPENLHIASVRDNDGMIRYPGPDLEDMLLKNNQAKLEDLKYDRVWWR